MKYHVYRQDHTGRGIRASINPLSSLGMAAIVMDLLRKHNKPNALNPRPAFYIVSEDEKGRFTPHPKS